MNDISHQSGERRNPIKLLNTDCVDIIFSYLLPDDVHQCESVSKNWREYTHLWMASFGISLHCRPYLADTDVAKTVKCYKETGRTDRYQSTWKYYVLTRP